MQPQSNRHPWWLRILILLFLVIWGVLGGTSYFAGLVVSVLIVAPFMAGLFYGRDLVKALLDPDTYRSKDKAPPTK